MNARSQEEVTAGATCECCGGYDVMEMAGKILCEDCLAAAGSGCAGPAE